MPHMICVFFDPRREKMPLSKQVLAECVMIDARFRYIWHRMGALDEGDRVPFGGGIEIIAELETYIASLENILA